ncbi:MAG: hypothetical protein ACFE9S_19905 [Candidatus Hermodarchaeota archaeon]
MPRKKKLSKNSKYFILIIILIGTIIGVWYIAFSPYSPFPTDTTTVKTASTFTLISYVDGEDASSFQEVTIWFPKSDATFDDEEDLYKLTKFEKEVTSKDADDVSIDLRDVEHAWLEIEDNSVFANTYIKLPTGVNRDLTYYVYDLSSDLNFNVLVRDTLASVTVANYQTNNNLTVIMDVDHEVTTNCHYGDNWAISTEDYNDMTLSEKKEVWDEALWQCQAPLYDPTVDEEKEYDKDLEKITDAPCIRCEFNTSVSTVDGNSAQINMTINDANKPIEIVISGTYIHLVFTDIITFDKGAYTFDFDITFGADIKLSDIDSGRIIVPRDDENLGTFTKYSDVGA